MPISSMHGGGWMWDGWMDVAHESFVMDERGGGGESETERGDGEDTEGSDSLQKQIFVSISLCKFLCAGFCASFTPPKLVGCGFV